MISRQAAAALLVLGILASSAMIYYGISLPRPRYPTLAEATQSCKCNSTALQARYASLVALYEQGTILQRSLVQVGTGFLIGTPAALLIGALPTGEPKRRPERRGLARFLFGAAVAAAGVVLFALIGGSDVYFARTGLKSSFAFKVLLFCDSVFGNHVGFSIAGALSLGAATLGAALALSRRGFPDGLRRGVAFVGAPAAIAFIAGVREYDTKEMTLHATNFMTGIAVNNTDLVSNWSVLIVAILATFAGIYVTGRQRFPTKTRGFQVAMFAALLTSLAVVAASISSQVPVP